MFGALGQAFAKAGKVPTDARTVRTAVVAKMMTLQEFFKPVFWHENGRGVGWAKVNELCGSSWSQDTTCFCV